MDARALEHGTHRATGDHTGTGAGRTQHHDTGGGLTLNRVGHGATDQRNAEEVLASLFDAFWIAAGTSLALP